MAKFKSNQINVKYIIILFLPLLLVSCNTTNPTDVKKSDAQRIKSIKYGKIISSLPVKVKGEGSLIGATTGAMIGGLLGTQVCGKELIAGAKCEEIAIVYATIGGAALGYVTEAFLGNHDGHQYILPHIDKKRNKFIQIFFSCCNISPHFLQEDVQSI